MAIQRLLVVDDDDDMRSMMTQYLRKSGYMVMAAATGRDVKAHLEKGRVDLVLLDVMLGDENGVQICANLRNTHDVPIILVSALSADHQRMQGYEVGADDYIAKPFNPDLLLARIRAVLRRGQRSASLNYRRNTSQYFFSGWQYDGKRDECSCIARPITKFNRQDLVYSSRSLVFRFFCYKLLPSTGICWTVLHR